MIAWHNGELLPIEGVEIRATDRGFLLGDGFFETMAAQNGEILRFEEHMKRLQNTAQFLKIPLTYSSEDIQKAAKDVLVGNQLKQKRASLRLTVTRGSGPRGLLAPAEINPVFLLTASPAPDHFEAAKIKTVAIRRNEFSPVSQIKSLNYLDNILAFEEAHDLGADEALILNTQGNIAEGAVSNIFFVQDNTLFTPQIKDGALPGVMRQQVIFFARRMGLKTIEQTLSPEIAKTCDEAFLTNSLYRVRPIKAIDTRPLPEQSWGEKLLETVRESEK